MDMFRPLAVLLLAMLSLEGGILFHWHDMQAAVPKIRTLMPDMAQAGAPAGNNIPGMDAHDLCFSDEPVWQDRKSQMDYCLMSAARGDPRAQAMVAQFYLDGSTPASQAQGLAWLDAMARNRRDGNLASAARFRLSALMARVAPSTLVRARELMLRFDAH